MLPIKIQVGSKNSAKGGALQVVNESSNAHLLLTSSFWPQVDLHKQGFNAKQLC